MSFSERLYTLRKLYGLSQQQLAKKAGVSQSSINYWEKGERVPGIGQIEKISKALDVPISALLETKQELEPFWTSYLEDNLGRLGCRLIYDEDDAGLWIEFPDGILEIDEKDLKELDAELISYLRFKLDELKMKHPKDFRPFKQK